jgi:predicted Zn-dependent peptidase
MIQFEKFVLDNGLRVIIHNDKSTPMVAVNVLYDVGSRDESPDKTGFAHLFEHLMFGGSENIDDFDIPIQMAGGESNAFTNADITNFYQILPAENLDTAFWLESDRMNKLDFSQRSLNIQKKVVVEEFKETSLNQPYGDVWHKLSAMAYKNHPYKWPTIGLVPAHIENAELNDVKDFFYKHYRPNNAIVVVAGNITAIEVMPKIEEWFGDIPRGPENNRNLPVERLMAKKESQLIKNTVPANAIFLAWHMPARNHPDYYACDLISDILSNGRSSRFYQKLEKENQIFSEIDAYISGSTDPGLFIVDGKPFPNIEISKALDLIFNEINDIKTNLVSKRELQKIKNKNESSLEYSEISILNKAINLAHFELMGDAGLINKQADFYNAVTPEDIKRVANEVLSENYCELIYQATETGN